MKKDILKIFDLSSGHYECFIKDYRKTIDKKPLILHCARSDFDSFHRNPYVKNIRIFETYYFSHLLVYKFSFRGLFIGFLCHQRYRNGDDRYG